ncbi:MAG: 4-oxalocrotonate tautomerase family protein [Thaumarchaeota archaeon]|nr:4-oxalocrotonate tautomerase family protein [Nitrososphaerota archaeon]
MEGRRLVLHKHKSVTTKFPFMPIITVSMYPGRTTQQKEDFAKAITKSAVEILKTKESHVIVVFEDNPKENWYLAGSPL